MTIRSVFIHGCEDLRPCKKCGALINHPCHSKNGNIVYAHMVRQRGEKEKVDAKRHTSNA